MEKPPWNKTPGNAAVTIARTSRVIRQVLAIIGVIGVFFTANMDPTILSMAGLVISCGLVMGGVSNEKV